MTLFYKVSGPCGSGKTHRAIEFAGHGARAGERFIFAGMTCEFVDSTFDDLRSRFSDVCARAIHSETCENVADALQKESDTDDGIVIFCTHTGLTQSPYIHHRSEWLLFVDEAPNPTWHIQLNLKRNRDKLLAGLTAKPLSNGPAYRKLEVYDVGLLDDIAKDAKHGVFSQPLKDLARKLDSGHWHIYVTGKQWDNLMLVRPKGYELLVFGLLDPAIFDGFADVTFMSANFDSTIAHQWLSRHNIAVRRHPWISQRLQYEKHPNGHLLTVYYATDRDWSKQFRDIEITMADGSTEDCNQVIANAAMKLFDHDNFLKLLNKDAIRRDPFFGKGTFLPQVSQGLNTYQHFHDAVVIPAYNATPPFYAFLEAVGGFDRDEVSHAIYAEQVYQAGTRISTRNLKNHDPKRLVVADMRAAKFMEHMFPTCNLQILPGVDMIPGGRANPGGRPSEYQTPDERDFARRQKAAKRKRRERWRDRHHVTQNSLSIYKKDLRDTAPSAWEQTLPYQGFAVSCWDSRAATWREYEVFEVEYDRHLIWQKAYTTDEFFAFIQRHATTTDVPEKHLANMFVPSFFDLKWDTEYGHSKGNHVVSQGAVLDFDHSELTPTEIHVALPYRMIAYSSFSYRPDDRKFRIAIPTMPMTYDASEALRRMMVRRIELVYPGKRHGADISKMTPVSLFYLPSVRPHGFAETFDGDDLDHATWIKACPPDIIDGCLRLSPNTPPPQADELPPPPPPRRDPTEQERQTHEGNIIARAIRTFQERGCGKGQGRPQLWSLFRTLKDRTSLNDAEIKAILWEQAVWAHNPEERRGEIDRLLRLT